MIRRVLLGLIAVAFAVAAHVTIQVNRLPTFSTSPPPVGELTALLRANGLDVAPRPVGPGTTIAGSLRFSLPECGADGFLLPVGDALLTDVQAIRFTELTGAAYASHVVRMTGGDSILSARAARALSGLQAALGLRAPRNGHTVLAVFLPAGCRRPLPDLQAFWAPAAR